jgi:hypothetical protein
MKDDECKVIRKAGRLILDSFQINKIPLQDGCRACLDVFIAVLHNEGYSFEETLAITTEHMEKSKGLWDIE